MAVPLHCCAGWQFLLKCLHLTRGFPLELSSSPLTVMKQNPGDRALGLSLHLLLNHLRLFCFQLLYKVLHACLPIKCIPIKLNVLNQCPGCHFEEYRNSATHRWLLGIGWLLQLRESHFRLQKQAWTYNSNERYPENTLRQASGSHLSI